MFCVSQILLIFSLTSLSHAITLSLPDKFTSGTAVTVQWTRDGADPVSFGLMQRSLQGNQPILDVTAVENAPGASSGTVSVVFSTAGQVLLAAISQTSLTSGEKPNQLAAGKQLTVIPANAGVAIPSSTSTSAVKPTVVPPTVRSSSSVITVSSSPTQAAPTVIDPPASTTAQTTTSQTEVESSSVLVPPKATLGNTIRSSTSSAIPAPSSSSPELTSPSPPPSASASAPSSPLSGAPLGSTSKPAPRRGLIALAVVLPLLFLIALLLFCFVRQRSRNDTRTRIDQFTAIWTTRARRRATISSFGGNDDREAGWRESEVSASVLGRAGPDSLGVDNAPDMSGLPSPVARRQQKLQLMVEQLAERNAALERMAGSAEPPPVYVESLESGSATRLVPREKIR
ncbi:hypothetical protein DFH06DRAFT_1190901 [Mycena polygramma]|nr:hypothetical protein DFH06DRAFT_1190901 [Mycena polygramma]